MIQLDPAAEREVYVSVMQKVCWEATAPITTEMFLELLHERGYVIGIGEWS